MVALAPALADAVLAVALVLVLALAVDGALLLVANIAYGVRSGSRWGSGSGWERR